MPPADELRFRQTVRQHLKQHRRQAYRGPIVLRLGFQTTDRNASHIHTLTKNFLDLLGRHANRFDTAAPPLLYSDDAQVHGLLVSCRHGEESPRVTVESRSLSEFCDDLSLAMTIDFDDTAEEKIDLYGGTGSLARDDFVRILGEDAWHSEWIRRQQSAQRNVLRYHGLRVYDLAYLFRSPQPGVRNEPFLDEMSTRWAERLRESPFRITLQELPQRPGSAPQYRVHVLEQLRAFRERFSRILSPIRVPVALEVLVKPPPASRAFATHDLDNVLRRYLVPGVIETFSPPSDFLWALDAAYPGQPTRFSERKPPISTATGLIRMEAWRIPRSAEDTSPGFISVALVSDDFGNGDSLGLLDKRINNWTERD